MSIGINNNSRIIESNTIGVTDYGIKTRSEMVSLASSAPTGAICRCSTYEYAQFVYTGNAWHCPGQTAVRQNRSGGSLAEGDVVITDLTYDQAVTTTTVNYDVDVFGVVLIGGADTEWMTIAKHMDCRVSVGITSNKGYYLNSYTTAKQCFGTATPTFGSFGVLRENVTVSAGAVLGWALVEPTERA